MVKNFASKGDVLLYPEPDMVKKNKDVIEDASILALMYESFYRRPCVKVLAILKEIGDKQMLQAKSEGAKSKRKKLAAYHTPPYIAEYMCSQVMAPFVDDAKKHRDAIGHILGFRGLDPAMGSGIFLVEMHDYLVKSILEISPSEDVEEVSRLSAGCIYGVDINSDAVALAKISMEFNHMKWALRSQVKNFVEWERAGPPTGGLIEGNFLEPGTMEATGITR